MDFWIVFCFVFALHKNVFFLWNVVICNHFFCFFFLFQFIILSLNSLIVRVFFVFLYHCTPTNCFLIFCFCILVEMCNINVCSDEKKSSSSSSLLCHSFSTGNAHYMPSDLYIIPCPRFYCYYWYSNRLGFFSFWITSNLNFNDNFVYTSLFVQHALFSF